MRGGNHFGMQQQNFGGMGSGSSPMHMGAFGHLMNLNDVTPQEDFSLHIKADANEKKAAKEATDKLEKQIKQTGNQLADAAKKGQAKLVKALDHAKKAIESPKLETVAAKPTATFHTLDDLIKEYGMEQEAAFVDSGDWANAFGPEFFAGQYAGFNQAIPYFELQDLSSRVGANGAGQRRAHGGPAYSGNPNGLMEAAALGANGHGQRKTHGGPAYSGNPNGLMEDFSVDYSYGTIPTAWNYGFDSFTDTPVNDWGFADVRYENPVPGYPVGFVF